MVIGLIIFGIIAVLIFFGALEKYFDVLGITSWLSFIIILAFVLCAILPDLSVGAVVINVSGLIVPLVTIVIFMVAYKQMFSRLHVYTAMAFAGIIIAGLKVVMLVYAVDMVTIFSIAIAVIASLISVLLASERIGAVIACMGGIIIGDVISGSIMYFTGANSLLAFGTYGIFDAISMSILFSLVLFEIIMSLKNIRLSKTGKENYNMEAGEDMDVSEQEDENIKIREELEKRKIQKIEREKLLKYLDDE